MKLKLFLSMLVACFFMSATSFAQRGDRYHHWHHHHHYHHGYYHHGPTVIIHN